MKQADAGSLQPSLFERIVRPGGVLLGTAFTLLVAGCQPAEQTVGPGDFTVEREVWSFQGQDGVHLSTDHFDVFTNLEDPEFVDYLPGFLETAYQYYAAMLAPGVDPSAPAPRLQTYVLAQRGDWDRFVERRFPTRFNLYRKISAGGFAEGNICVVYDIGRAQTLSVLAHEGMHQYFAAHFNTPLPAWLNEGLATYCEAVEIRGRTPYFTPENNTFRINSLCEALSTDSMIPLKEILSTNAGEVIEVGRTANTAAYYAQAWALVVFLRHGAEGRYSAAFGELLHDIAGGTMLIKSRTAVATADSPSQITFGESVFTAYFTSDFEAFEREFRDFAIKTCWH